MTKLRGPAKEYWLVPREELKTFKRGPAAANFLKRLKPDGHMMSALRQMVKDYLPELGRAKDDQILAAVADLLSSGRLVMVIPYRGASATTDEAIAASQMLPAARGPQARETEHIEDPPTFPSSHDGAAQAAVLREAARLAVPFCEECERARAGGH